MKTAPIAPASIDFDADGIPFARAFDDRYHAGAGALAQAAHVFLRGNGLPERWRNRSRFVILETGFGLGLNFLATWAAWRRDPARSTRLHYVAIDKHPPTRVDLARVHAAVLAAGDDDTVAVAPLAARLREAWPPLTGDLHRLAFDDERVELLLAFGDAGTWLRRLQLRADAVFLDGFAPAHNPEMWSEALFAALPALCATAATAATWSVARSVRDGLALGGFEVERAPGFAGKREMTVARFIPRHRPAPVARRQSGLPGARDAIVVGAGLAGAMAARALAAQGLVVTVLEAAPAPASAASGNRAGLVRSLVARDDGAHARWHRAAALQAQRLIAPLVDGRDLGAVPVPGQFGGVLHLGGHADDLQRMAAAWPADLVQALDGQAAEALAGVPGIGPAWFFPGGGWVDPSALVRRILGGDEGGTAAASGIGLRTGCPVAQLQRRGTRWLACDAQGRPQAEADLVVLANAADAARLVPATGDAGSPPCGWRLGLSRGQVTQLPPTLLRGRSLPRLPLARNGYVIPLPDGGLLCGATQSTGDDDTSLRAPDHLHNLAVLQRLAGLRLDLPEPGVLGGRVGWRCHADDRLPLVGALPLDDARPAREGAAGARLSQPRHVPRASGLFVLGALGSRGLTGAALGAQVLAAWVCDTPFPVDTDLLDAVDAARYRAREARRGLGSR